jgi:predicted nucleic acid-binding protein
VTIWIDSDILIEVCRGRDASVLERWLQFGHSNHVLLISPISVAELWAGARVEEHSALKNLFASLICVPIDAETGRLAGEYLRTYRRTHGTELGDALIAAGAAIRGAALWTRNRKHYPMMRVPNADGGSLI